MVSTKVDEDKPHKDFVENIASDLLHHKGLTVEEYCENIVKSQSPLYEIALVLFGHLYKLHICVFIKVLVLTIDIG